MLASNDIRPNELTTVRSHAPHDANYSDQTLGVQSRMDTSETGQIYFRVHHWPAGGTASAGSVDFTASVCGVLVVVEGVAAPNKLN